MPFILPFIFLLLAVSQLSQQAPDIVWLLTWLGLTVVSAVWAINAH